MVVALIGLLAGWAVSRVSMSAYRVDANVRLLQNLLIGAQQTAITRAVPVQVMFDRGAGRVRVLLEGYVPGADSLNADTFRSLDGAQFLTPESTIDGASVFYATGSGLIASRPALQQAIRFAPNGNVSGGDVVLYIGSAAGRPNDLRAIAITGATGRTAVWSYANGQWVRRSY